MGIQVDSPLQRQWTILDRSGSILRITATVLGACCSSNRAVKTSAPTRILSMPNTNRPTISTHVLDTTRGEPAAGVTVTLWRLDGTQSVSQGSRETDADGRIGELADKVKAQSAVAFREQGYDRDTTPPEVFLRLVSLNEEYEQKFGFRFVVFVNRRSKEAIVPILEARLRGTRDEERRTALREILAIAEDRLKRGDQ